MLGYMGKSEALAIGFTHQGRYYGIPLWITDSQRPMIVAKWAPMEVLITGLQRFELWLVKNFFPSRKFCHQLTNVRAINY